MVNESGYGTLTLFNETGLLTRFAPDIWPAGYPAGYSAFFYIRFHLPDIRLAGYRISGSSIDLIIDVVSNVNYIVFI